MSDSRQPEALAAEQERNRERRLEGIRRWAEYVDANPPDVWGEQLNRLVDEQLQAARDAEVSIDVRKRVENAGRQYSSSDE